MSDATRRELDWLEKAGLVLLALQIGLFAKLWSDLGFDRATDSYLILVMLVALLVSNVRRLAQRPPSRGAAKWVVAARAAALAVLALATLVIGIERLVPQLSPPPALVLQSMFVLMWAIIALKGAGIGKLKPGSAIGLRVPWTRKSRLAWDRAHRTLGRVLFWGGLVGLTAGFVVPPITSALMWVVTVGVAVATALIESWRAWRVDPDRGRLA